jgi:hypothetical protein
VPKFICVERCLTLPRTDIAHRARGAGACHSGVAVTTGRARGLTLHHHRILVGKEPGRVLAPDTVLETLKLHGKVPAESCTRRWWRPIAAACRCPRSSAWSPEHRTGTCHRWDWHDGAARPTLSGRASGHGTVQRTRAWHGGAAEVRCRDGADFSLVPVGVLLDRDLAPDGDYEIVAWFQQNLPRCLELVPRPRHDKFADGVRTFLEDNDL